MKLKDLKKKLKDKWWYVQLWRVSHKIKEIPKSIKSLIEVLINRKDKDKLIQSDYDIGENLKLFYWRYDSQNECNENLGDYLSKIVVDYFRPEYRNMSTQNKCKTLYAVGSVLGFRCQDAVVWGSGFLSNSSKFMQRARFSSLDIRVVRGPKTRKLLLKLGKDCPEVYGDPAILMPEIYYPKNIQKRHDVSVILHYNDKDIPVPQGINTIDIITTDYKHFIEEIVSSKLVISSSLHGIILAESYGIPAIFLNNRGNKVPFKYEDWYNSTGRYDIVMVTSVEQALTVTPMPLPSLENMQKELIDTFPYDLWE